MVRYVLFTVGPTGAGKSFLPTKVNEALGIKVDWESVIIDPMVETHADYKCSVDKLIIKEFSNIVQSIELDKDSNLIYPEKQLNELYKSFTDSYFNVRNNSAIVCSSNNENNKINGCYDSTVANKLSDLSDGSGIVIEIVGDKETSFSSWFDDKKINLTQYHIIVAYSILSVDKLRKRNLERFKQSIKEYSTILSCDKTPAQQLSVPRLPNIKELQTKIPDIVETLGKTINSNYISDETINTLLIFNNNETMELQHKIDRTTVEEDKTKIIESVKNVFNSDNMLGGKKTRKNNRRKCNRKSRRANC